MSKQARVYPSYRYHKDLGEKIIHNEEQHQLLEENGWKDSPAAFIEEKKVEEPSELDKRLAELQGDSAPLEGSEEQESEEPGEKEEGAAPELSAEELRLILIDSGRSKKELKGKSVEELKSMLAE